LEGPSKAVLEACWNWGLTHDLLEELEEVDEVVLAHPLKTRLIADAQIKTDRLDAFALATLLRGNLLARAHVPRRETRVRKNLLRQRLYWARLRTMLRNRIHALLDRQLWPHARPRPIARRRRPACGHCPGRKARNLAPRRPA
jgi:transposase